SNGAIKPRVHTTDSDPCVILSEAKNPSRRSKKGTATISRRSLHRSRKAEELSKACAADQVFRGNGDSPRFRAQPPLPLSDPSDRSAPSDPSDRAHDQRGQRPGSHRLTNNPP